MQQRQRGKNSIRISSTQPFSTPSPSSHSLPGSQKQLQQSGLRQRYRFSSAEHRQMWTFFIGLLKSRCEDAIFLKHSIWMEYTKNYPTNRSYQNIESHFRKQMLPRAWLPQHLTQDELRFVLLSVQRPFTREFIRQAAHRLGSKIYIDTKFGYVKKIIPIESHSDRISVEHGTQTDEAHSSAAISENANESADSGQNDELAQEDDNNIEDTHMAENIEGAHMTEYDIEDNHMVENNIEGTNGVEDDNNDNDIALDLQHENDDELDYRQEDCSHFQSPNFSTNLVTNTQQLLTTALSNMTKRTDTTAWLNIYQQYNEQLKKSPHISESSKRPGIDNEGDIPSHYRRVLRLRSRLILDGVLPLAIFYDGIPKQIAKHVAALYDFLEWMLLINDGDDMNDGEVPNTSKNTGRSTYH